MCRVKCSPTSAILFAVLAVFCQTGAFAEDLAPQPLPNGISFTVGEEHVELLVAAPHAFHLHIDTKAFTRSSPSIYLDEQARPNPTFKVFHEAAAVGIETAFGKLLVDPDRKMWSLRGSTGEVLADWAPLGGQKPEAATPSATFQLSIAPSPAVAHPLYYGSGSVPRRGLLTQQEGTAKTDNGSVALPQYWSTAGYGVLVIGQDDNAPGSWKSDPDSGRVDWQVPGSGADLYLCLAPDLYAWLQADAELTGFAPVPPLWSFGYQQSRWGWTDKAYIDDTLTHFRQDQLPVDTFIVDFEWYTNTPDYAVKPEGQPTFADFDWNPKLFPAPQAQIAEFARQGLHLVGIRKPRLGNTENLRMAREKGWILPPNPDDPNSEGIRSRNLDFSKPEVRTWWAASNRKFLEDGMVGFWNDEGETVFDEYSYWNLSEVTLQKQVQPNGRFWSLNRSFIPGMQRFGAAVWTGDVRSDWKTLARTPGELLSYGLSGMPYSACDIGGYAGEPSPELLTRWMQAGVFFPVMRAHSSHRNTPRFPWLFGPEAEAAIRKALDLRYQLIPYYYSLSHANHSTAAPLMRPLVMEFPADEKAAGITDEWLMGKGLLAAPVLNEGGARSVYLPDDRWFEFGSTRSVQGPQTVQVAAKPDEIPVYVRAGTLLPLGPVAQYTGQASEAPLEMQIYGGRDAKFDFIEDDGQTSAYQSGAARTTSFSWNEQTRTLSWKVTGSYTDDRVFRALKAVLFLPQGEKTEKQAALGKDGSINFL